MAIVINGSGTVTGLAVGGLPDGTVDSGTLAVNSRGTVLQVVSTTYSTNVNNATSSYVDTGLSAVITPSSSSNKIFVCISQALGADRDSQEAGVKAKLMRGATEIQDYPEAIRVEAGGVGASKSTGIWSMTYLDSPSTTSATTYKTTCAPQNTANNGLTRSQWGSTSSTITLMEIAG